MPPAVPLHPDDNRAEAGPGVEPGVEHDELLGAAVCAHRGERGDQKGPATIGHGQRPFSLRRGVADWPSHRTGRESAVLIGSTKDWRGREPAGGSIEHSSLGLADHHLTGALAGQILRRIGAPRVD